MKTRLGRRHKLAIGPYSSPDTMAGRIQEGLNEIGNDLVRMPALEEAKGLSVMTEKFKLIPSYRREELGEARCHLPIRSVEIEF